MAHRGNSVAALENTLAAFRRALDDGADIVETDLHLTQDGVFVCIHDATLDRTTDGYGAVADLTLAEIRRYSASYGRPEFAAERVPALGELTAILPPDVFLALELKTDRFLERGVAQRLIDQLRAGGVFDRTVVLSFSLERVQTVQRAAPEIPIGFITLSRLAPRVSTQMIGPFWPLLALNPLYTWWAHRRGMLIAPLDPWPNGRLWLYRLLRCDAILTNDPASTVKRLGRTLKS
jgi:glycerophosphoryl diester phosphodiesterase